MTHDNARIAPVAARSARNSHRLAVKLALVSAAALMIAGCKPEDRYDAGLLEARLTAFLLAGLKPEIVHRTINVGGPEALPLLRIAEICAEQAGGLPVTLRPFPEDRAVIDIGSYSTDSSLLAATLGRKPSIRFEDGIARTLAYYRTELAHYLDPDNPQPFCALPEHKGIQHRLLYSAV